jgi:hypothetical protein
VTRYAFALAIFVAACVPAASPTRVPPPTAVTPTVPSPVGTPQPVQSAAPTALPPPGNAVAPSQPTAPSRPATAPPKSASTSPSAPPKTIANSAVPAPAPPVTAAAQASAPAQHVAAPLDLKSLEQRLKETNAIGVLTKLSLKNQVDDLITRFKTYHEGHRPPTLTELRPAFELLLMKVLSLLQDHDTALAGDINRSREAIWGVLTDPQKLAQFTS